MRKNSPLTFETVIKQDDKTWVSNIYIKDEHNAAFYTKDPDGVEKRVIYTENMAYQISCADREVFVQDGTKTEIDDIIQSYLVPLSIDNVKGAIYSSGTGKVNDTEYNTETVSAENQDTVYYFDKDTDTLVYISSGGTVTKVGKLENNFSDEEMFEIPSDFNVVTLEDMVERAKAAQAAEEAAGTAVE